MTAYTNTWALGPLKPGATAKFDWGVTAIKAGHLRDRVPGRRGAERQGEGRARERRAAAGRFKVTIHSAPQQSYVNGNGQVVVIK